MLSFEQIFGSNASFKSINRECIERSTMVIKTALLAAALTLESWSVHALSNNWEKLWVTANITIHKKEIAGHDFPIFRGQGIFHANIREIVTEIVDSTKHMEWMYRCIESRVVKKISPSEAVFYNRVEAPFPISDRDVVAYATVKMNSAGHEILVEFQAVNNPLQPVIYGVIRIPKLEGFYRLKVLGPHKTRVIYQVEADVAGYIPKILAELVAKHLPAYTLLALRNRVYSSRGKNTLPNEYFAKLPRY